MMYTTPLSGFQLQERSFLARLQRLGREFQRSAVATVDALARSVVGAILAALRWRPYLWHRAVAAYAHREIDSLRALHRFIAREIVEIEAALQRLYAHRAGIEGAIAAFEMDATRANVAATTKGKK